MNPQESVSVAIPAPANPDTRRATIQLLEIIGETELRTSYAKDLISAELSRDAFDQDYRLARIFSMSGIFEDIKGQTAEQSIATAMTKIRIGRAWGINEADAMTSIYFQKGKPCVQNDIIAAKLDQAGWGWDIEWYRDEGGRATGCKLWAKYRNEKFLDRDGAPVAIEFNAKMASEAMVWEGGKQIRLIDKWNYKSWPDDMYFYRAIARFKRRLVPGILCGAKLPDEIDEMEPAATPSTSAERATNTKTEALSEKLSSARTARVPKAADPILPATPPTPDRPPESISESRARIAAAIAPVVPAPQPPPNNNDESAALDARWQQRISKAYFTELGEAEFRAVLNSVTGSQDIKSISLANHVQVDIAMDRAVKRNEQPRMEALPAVTEPVSGKPKESLF